VLSAASLPAEDARKINPMRVAVWPLRILLFLALTQACGADCIPFSDAEKHLGETRCIAGKVMHVEQGSKGVHFLDFCDDRRVCPFTVVVFPHDLKHVGDVRQLQGRSIEIHGDVKEYDGRAEIILSEARQLGGKGAHIPPLPKNYDVEKRGHYSAGTLSRPHASTSTTKKRQPAKIPIEVPEDPTE